MSIVLRTWFYSIVVAMVTFGTTLDSVNQDVTRKDSEFVVRRQLDNFFAAAERKDWTTIDRILAPDFEFYSDDAIVLDRSAFLGAMREDSMDVQKLTLSNVKVELSRDGRMAWVKYRASLKSSIKGKPYNMQSVETVVFRKEGSKWQMTHNQASIKKLP